MGWEQALSGIVNNIMSGVGSVGSYLGVGPGGGMYNTSAGPAGGAPPPAAGAPPPIVTPPASLVPATLPAPSAAPAIAPPVAPPPTAAPAPGIIQQAIASLAKNPAEAANIWQAYQRYQQQQNLADPNWVAEQAAKLNTGLTKPLKQRITNQTDAAMAERGLGGAPGLYKEAQAEALAPYQYEAQQNALREFLASQQESMGAYPMGGPMGDFSQFLSQYKLQQGTP